MQSPVNRHAAASKGNLPMRILLVENDELQGRYLRHALGECGFVVDWVCDGVDGLHHARTLQYQLLILEVKLPGLSGWDLLRALRRTQDTPALFLTACGALEERIKGLELGADDYMLKPFAFAELVARVRTLLRRGARHTPGALEYADVRLDTLRRRVTRGGLRIELTAKQFALLHLLMCHPGEVMSRAQIASLVWDMNFDSDTNVVDVAMRRLRARLEHGFTDKLLHTVWGAGYVLEAREGQK